MFRRTLSLNSSRSVAFPMILPGHCKRFKIFGRWLGRDYRGIGKDGERMFRLSDRRIFQIPSPPNSHYIRECLEWKRRGFGRITLEYGRLSVSISFSASCASQSKSSIVNVPNVPILSSLLALARFLYYHGDEIPFLAPVTGVFLGVIGLGVGG